MASIRALLIAVALAAAWSPVAGAGANPIRKVVNLLQNMQEKVKAEGEAEAKLYDEYMCYCETGAKTLEASIADAKAKIEALEAQIKSGGGELEALKAQLAEHQTSREEAKEAMATATALREKEATAFAKVKADTEQNIAAIASAVAALEKGMGGSFIQTSAASSLKKIIMMKADMDDERRNELLAFLSGSQSDEEEYAPASGEIVGMLKQMGDTMAADLKEATATENSAIQAYEGLMAAKTKEVDTLTAQIEEEMMRVGEMGVGGATAEDDLEDAKEQVKEDTAFLATMEKGCKTKTAEWEVAKKLRAEELVALADTIKVLNDDEALELFKKTLPSASASFMQVTTTTASLKAKALAILHSAPRRFEVDLIALALHGKANGFEKIIGMIDAMVVNLGQEQKDDDAKVAYCNKEFDAAEDKKKGLEVTISDSEAAIDELKGSIAALVEEIDALAASIKDLDKSVAEATEQREAENKEYKELMTNDAMAKEVLGFAKNRLNKFYNKKLYKAPPKRELSEEDSIVVSMGGTLAPTAPPGGIADTGIGGAASLAEVSAHDHGVAAPPPPPAGPSAAKPKTEESAGVIAMIDLLVKDLDKEMQESEVTEKDAQADYEAMLEAAKTKRAEDTTSLTNKEAAKAEAEEALGVETGKLEDTKTDLMQTEEYIHSLHVECDWLLKYYETRKEARTSEIDALEKAKAVLSGADYSLVQTGRAVSALRR